MKKILITGKNSYIGMSFESWMSKQNTDYEIDTLDMKDPSWHMRDFSNYDVVLHVAGLAHTNPKKNMESKYYQINTDLAFQTAKKAKDDGVSQFIFMSSIIVYGLRQTDINLNTIPNPDNFYGNSKLKAEENINKLVSNSFKVVVLRSPMVYGKGSKGNYPRLSQLARKTLIFPDFKNKRSLIYIDNLSNYIYLMIKNNESGLFFPQNLEYSSTSEIVFLIAHYHNHRIIRFNLLNWVIKLLIKKSKNISKVFGDKVISQSLSNYKEVYQNISFVKSIELTEGK